MESNERLVENTFSWRLVIQLLCKITRININILFFNHFLLGMAASWDVNLATQQILSQHRMKFLFLNHICMYFCFKLHCIAMTTYADKKYIWKYILPSVAV